MQSTDTGGELRQQHHPSNTASTTSLNSGKTANNETTTTSFTTTNTPNSTALNNDNSATTPSKNPFKQQLSQRQNQNGHSDPERGTSYPGILGVGATTPTPPTNPLKMTSPPSNTAGSGGSGPPLPPPDHNRQEDYRAAGSWAAFKNWMIGWRGSRRLVLVIVAIALLLDNMLLTTVGKFFNSQFPFSIFPIKRKLIEIAVQF